MSALTAPSAIINVLAHFWRVMEKSGMTIKHAQRVISRPKLREAIVALIEADMNKLWQPDPDAPRVPTNLDRLTVPFNWVDSYDSFDSTTPVGERLETIISVLGSKVNSKDVASKLFLDGNMRDPMPLLYYYGLIGDREVTIEELASGFDVQPARIRDRIKKAKWHVELRIRELLNGDYSVKHLLETGLVTPEWAASTDDVRILGFEHSVGSVSWWLDLAFKRIHGASSRLTHISQLTSLSEAQLREAMAFHDLNADEPDPLDEIKTALSKFGLSLAESAPIGE